MYTTRAAEEFEGAWGGGGGIKCFDRKEGLYKIFWMQQPLPRGEICLLSFDINYAKISTREGQKLTDTFYKSNVT